MRKFESIALGNLTLTTFDVLTHYKLIVVSNNYNFYKNFLNLHLTPLYIMQTKLIAAAIATTAASIKLEAPTTLLAQVQDKSGQAQVAGVDTECHGTYAY